MVQGTPFIVRLLHGLFTPKVPIIGCDIAGRVEAVGYRLCRVPMAGTCVSWARSRTRISRTSTSCSRQES
jgi:hypothetical protein